MKLTPNPLCGANLKRGDGTCGNKAGFRTDHPGFGNCYLHGGSTPTGTKHAESLRKEFFALLLGMAPAALAELERQITAGETDADRFRAVKDVLDRIGMGAKFVHEHTGPDGGPIPVEVRAAELAERARALRPAKAARNTARSRGKAARSRGKAAPKSET